MEKPMRPKVQKCKIRQRGEVVQKGERAYDTGTATQLQVFNYYINSLGYSKVGEW